MNVKLETMERLGYHLSGNEGADCTDHYDLVRLCRVPCRVTFTDLVLYTFFAMRGFVADYQTINGRNY